MNFDRLKNLDAKNQLIIFARHAERYEIGSINSHHEVLLTEKGIKDSYLFGKKVSYYPGVIRLYHSTVARCRQTAENIHKGVIDAGGKSNVCGELHWLLGNYMFDKEFIDWYINKHDVNSFLRTWFDGKFARDIVTPIDEISSGFLSAIRSQFSNDGSLIIDISHDWNMSIMLEHFMGLKHENIGIPIFLDHIIFRKDGEKIKMAFHEFEADIVRSI